ncbi:MAG: serine hydrolase [Desulfobacterales bacterium]|nr:serine hydrolase [Desulfobacterales bacterium]
MKAVTHSLIVLLVFCLCAPFSPRSVSAQGPPTVQKWPIISTIHKRRPPVAKTSGHKRNRAASINKSAISSTGLARKLSARSAIVIDARTGRHLFSLDPNRPGQPASTIKVLTGLIAIQQLNNRDQVPVSRRAARMPRSKVYLDPRRSYHANDLIDSVLVASANDASVALAEKMAGSEKAFAKMMTSKARQLGAFRTICKNASGLTAKGQQTTARDLATIFNKAMKNKEFAARIQRATMKGMDGTTLRNHNKALWRIDGAQGGKTGYTYAARQTYVGKFKRGQTEIVVALLGSSSMWKDISRLVEYGFAEKQRPGRAAGRKLAAAGPRRQQQHGPGIPVLADRSKIAQL